MAKDLGADAVVNTKAGDGLREVREFTGGRGADIAFECVGGKSMPTTLAQAVSYTRIGGKVAIVGGFDSGPQAIPLDWQHIQMAEIQLIPSASYSFWGIRPEMKMCLDLLAEGKLNAKKLITQRFTLDQINEAFEIDADKEKNHSVFVAISI